MERKSKKIFAFFIFVVLFFLANTSKVFASTLFLSPEGGTYKVGDTISVRVKVASTSESINAISARVSYSQEYLALTSISKSGSIISLWAQEPSYSNLAGSASFEGVVLSGYTGTGANVVILNFKALKEGSANVSFVSASVLANDGEGTNTLNSTNQAVFNINKSIGIPKPEINNIVSKPKEESKIDTQKVEPKETKTQVSEIINKYYISELPMEYVYLVVVWVLIMFVFIYLYLHYRYLVKKELLKAKKITEHSFKILKDDQKLKDSTILNHDIEDAQKVLLDEIDDIEKI